MAERTGERFIEYRLEDPKGLSWKKMSQLYEAAGIERDFSEISTLHPDISTAIQWNDNSIPESTEKRFEQAAKELGIRVVFLRRPSDEERMDAARQTESPEEQVHYILAAPRPIRWEDLEDLYASSGIEKDLGPMKKTYFGRDGFLSWSESVPLSKRQQFEEELARRGIETLLTS